MLELRGLLGICVLLFIAWLSSENKRRFPKRVVIAGLAAQFALALLFFKFPLFQQAFLKLNAVVDALRESTTEGTKFVFGYLGGGDAPFEVKYPRSSFVLAFQALPLILVISALSSLLFYWRVLPWVVKAAGYALKKTMGVGGALGLGVAANIFLGMVEAPLIVAPYVRKLSRSELFALMVSGMATIAGTVLFVYAMILDKTVPNALGNILVASIISAPASVLVAYVMVPPEDGDSGTEGAIELVSPADSAMDALVSGVETGVKLLINIIAMLIVLVSLVALANIVLRAFPGYGGTPITLQRTLGWIMAPVVWLIGVPWSESVAAGQLMGIKTILNEMIAYVDMANMPEGALSAKSRIIMTYALCGFANFGSLGIMIGGLNVIAPERRKDFLSLGMKSIVAGTIATLMTGAIAGIMLGTG